jgi:hypothetical protein
VYIIALNEWSKCHDYKGEYAIRLLRVHRSLQDQQVTKNTLYQTTLSVCHNILVSYAGCTLELSMRSQQ